MNHGARIEPKLRHPSLGIAKVSAADAERVASAVYQSAARPGPASQPARRTKVSSGTPRRSNPRFSPARDVGYRVSIRIIDIVISALALTVLAPLMLVVVLLIKIDSPGPVLFRQVRRGLRRGGAGVDPEDERLGRPFTLYKFRTMFADARETFPELYRYKHTEEELRILPIKVLVSRKQDPREIAQHPDLGTGLVDDPRVTRVGRWLRRTSLDELPNFLNVLKGDMALVGPRPDIAENIRYYSPAHLRKLSVKPGITGLAQIMGRGKLSFLEINDYDVEYVDHQSLGLDLTILLKTIPSVLKRDGAF